MTLRVFSHLATAGAVLLMACNSSDGAPTTTGSAGGNVQGGTGDGGRAGRDDPSATTAAGAAQGHGQRGGDSGQGGRSGPSATAGTSGGTDDMTGTGGMHGGNTSHAAAGASGEAGQGGSGSRPQGDASTTAQGSRGGSSATDGGPAITSDAATVDAHVVGNPRRVLLCDEGNRRVLLVDLEGSGSCLWSTQVNDPNKHGDSLRDLQLVGGDRVAASTAKGYVEIDLKTGEIKKEVSKFTGVESLRRLPNGNTVLGANAEGGVTLQELDNQDAPVAGHKVTFTSYGQLRLFRRTPDGTFLMGVGAKLAEVGWDGKTIWEMTIPDGDWVFQGLRLADRTIAVTSGYGAAIVIVDPATKKVLATVGGKKQAQAAAIVPNFYAGFQVLSNGHFVVTNWEGHEGGHGDTGVQLLEYDNTGMMTWKWKQDPKLVSSLHGVIVLDGLDTSKLHDDVQGVLAPVGP